MQLDSRVKVIALSFLSVLVDVYLSHILRCGKWKTVENTAPVI
jgi:hypothetical protein